MTTLAYRWYAPPDAEQRLHAFVEGRHRSVCTRERRDVAEVMWRRRTDGLRCWQCISGIRLANLAEVVL